MEKLSVTCPLTENRNHSPRLEFSYRVALYWLPQDPVESVCPFRSRGEKLAGYLVLGLGSGLPPFRLLS